MKRFMLIYTVFLFLSGSVFSQDYVENDKIMIFVFEGWKIKAKNKVNARLNYTFSYVTEGTDASGEVVFSQEDTYGPATLQPYEERDLFTAPQDPKKEIKYVFKNVKLIKTEQIVTNRRRNF